jgi:2-polyprenyl-3-methyl-5-hydroxy-6-metoxy-1,4-benzoquinol methylase
MFSEGQNNINVASLEEVKDFLKRSNFDGYMGVGLPHDLKVPGADLTKTADAVFKYPVRGKTVLDVGCRYGYFCQEALARGAVKAVGIEMDKGHVDIAREISKLWGDNVGIVCEDLRDIDDSVCYDVTLLLNLLHHLVSPVEAMGKLAGITNETMIVEFATLLSPQAKMGFMSRVLFRLFCSDLPLAYVGSRKYHRTWYFSKSAFINLFVKQMNLFTRVEFRLSPRKKGRMLAYCFRNSTQNQGIF